MFFRFVQFLHLQFLFAGLLSNLTFCLWIFCWCLARSRAWIIKFIIHVQKVIQEEFYCSHMFSPIKLWRILMFCTINFQLQVWNKLCQWSHGILNVWYEAYKKKYSINVFLILWRDNTHTHTHTLLSNVSLSVWRNTRCFTITVLTPPRQQSTWQNKQNPGTFEQPGW